MAVDLDSDEAAKVAVARLANKPKYFNASAGVSAEISDDFESFIILQDPLTIQYTLTQIGTVSSIAPVKAERDAVLFEAWLADEDDRAAMQTEIDLNIFEYNLWRQAWQAGKFNETSEVGLVTNDLQSVFGELAEIEGRVKHQEAMNKRVIDRLRQSISSNQLRQIQSWPTPLLAY